MTRPILLVLDHDPTELDRLGRELEDRYSRHYEIVRVGSSDEASEQLEQFAGSGREVALVVAAQWRRGEPGCRVLESVHGHHPHAMRAAVITWLEWGDPGTGRAIFDGIAEGRFEHYVIRPSRPADENFHQMISTVLLEWAESNREAPYRVRIVGESWTGRSYELREALQQCAVSHHFCLADSSEGRALVAAARPGAMLPLVVFPDGRILENPTNLEISESTGGPVDPGRANYDVIIVGAGPAGLSAAVYGASEGLSTLVVDQGGIGGQATSSSRIRNYLGFPRGVSGRQLALNAYSQAWVFGADFAFMQEVTDIIREDGHLFVVLSDGRRVRTLTVLLAMGVSYRRLGVPALEELVGAGVYYGGATSEAPGQLDREVFVVGGANSAGQAALHLAQYARTVTLVVRSQTLRDGMSDYLVRQVEATDNIRTRLGQEVVGGGGDGRLDHLILRDIATKSETRAPAHALFILIGAEPFTGWLPTEIEQDNRGYVLTGADLQERADPVQGRARFLLETSMPGVFAAGDVRHGSVKRVASAVGEGSIAVQLMHQYFERERLSPYGCRAVRATTSGAVSLGVRPPAPIDGEPEAPHPPTSGAPTLPT